MKTRHPGHHAAVCCGIALTTLLTACGGGGGGGSNATTNNPPPPPPPSTFTLSGSVGDGPVTAAELRLHDSQNSLIAETQSDSAAQYSMTIDAGVALPAQLVASGGTDLVSGQPLDFELLALVTSESDQVANLTPTGTLATRAALCAGTNSATDVQNFATALIQDWQFGASDAMGNSLTEAIDATNIEAVVLTNEALAESIRRTTDALNSTGIDIDDVIEVLACDLADGAMDGTLLSSVGTDDARVTTVASIVVAQVSLEVIAGRLNVNDADATSAMHDAIRTVLPGLSSPDVTALPLHTDTGSQAVQRLASLLTQFGDNALTDLILALDTSNSTLLRSQVDTTLDATRANALHAIVDLLALADDATINEIRTRLIAAPTTPAPTVAFSADPSEIDSGNASTLSWTTTDADSCSATGAWNPAIGVSGSFDTGALTSATQFDLTCVGRGGTASSSVTVTIAGDPNPTTIDRIALAGCSQTRDWVGDGTPLGYEDITGTDLFTDSATFGGGSVDLWINDASTYLADFTAATDGTEDIILAQVCIRTNVDTFYADVERYVEVIEETVPGKTVYLMPLDVSPESTGNCARSGYADSVTFIDQAVAAGIAEYGPAIDPLYSNAETSDGCHPNDTGAARMTETVQAWLDSLN